MTKTSSLRAFFFILVCSSAYSASALTPVVYVDGAYTEKKSEGHTFGVDAFSSIQKGVDAVDENGTVYVEKGNYAEALTITKSLTLSGHVSHVTTGASLDAPVIDGKGSVAAIMVQGSTTPLQVSIFNFHILGGNHGVLVVQKVKMQVSNNTIDGYWKNGITFGSTVIRGTGEVSGTINNNIVRGKGPTDGVSQNGIQVAEHNVATITNNTILDNVYANSGSKWATGIFIHNTEGVIAKGNTLVNNQAGINILQAAKNILEGNTFMGNRSTNAAIMVTDFDDATHPSSNNIIDKNTINGGYVGIWASYGPKNRYTNNTISSTSKYAMYFWDTDSNVVSNNTVSLATTSTGAGYGIALDGGDTKKRSIGSDYNYISDNVVTGSDSGFYASNNSDKNILLRNKF